MTRALGCKTGGSLILRGCGRFQCHRCPLRNERYGLGGGSSLYCLVAQHWSALRDAPCGRARQLLASRGQQRQSRESLVDKHSNLPIARLPVWRAHGHHNNPSSASLCRRGKAVSGSLGVSGLKAVDPIHPFKQVIVIGHENNLVGRAFSCAELPLLDRCVF